MKKRPGDLSAKEKMQTLDLLYTAASCVRGRNAMKLFLRDLLTESERVMLGRRIWIARLLIAGKDYEDIGRELGVSYATVYRVERWLHDRFPGYESTLDTVEKEIGDMESQLTGIDATVQEHKARYDNTLDQLHNVMAAYGRADFVEMAFTPDVQVVEEPHTTKKPIRPNWPMNLLAGFIVGGGLGLMLHYWMHRKVAA